VKKSFIFKKLSPELSFLYESMLRPVFDSLTFCCSALLRYTSVHLHFGQAVVVQDFVENRSHQVHLLLIDQQLTQVVQIDLSSLVPSEQETELLDLGQLGVTLDSTDCRTSFKSRLTFMIIFRFVFITRALSRLIEAGS
jgi:hypothetical protein